MFPKENQLLGILILSASWTFTLDITWHEARVKEPDTDRETQSPHNWISNCVGLHGICLILKNEMGKDTTTNSGLLQKRQI